MMIYLSKYGQNYKYGYGWASEALKIINPTFRDIELSVELDHQRPDYKAASANIHANPTGVLTRLGLLPDDDAILAGPSDVGLVEPAQLTIISLMQITTSVLTTNSNIDMLVACETMMKYGKKVEREFLKVEERLYKNRN